ncbi:hypothetical protein ACP6PL_30520 [Dapis sp. BLCC M126]|uniref:hypothetical protein n=1 Tax=Dapis sp. BLCC M126 TaxID=3400189 RepID=UPI003CEDBDA0
MGDKQIKQSLTVPDYLLNHEIINQKEIDLFGKKIFQLYDRWYKKNQANRRNGLTKIELEIRQTCLDKINELLKISQDEEVLKKQLSLYRESFQKEFSQKYNINLNPPEETMIYRYLSENILKIKLTTNSQTLDISKSNLSHQSLSPKKPKYSMFLLICFRAIYLIIGFVIGIVEVIILFVLIPWIFIKICQLVVEFLFG